MLLGILQQRIELDKECMFQYTQLRKEVRLVDGQTSVAPVLMRYQRGCQQVGHSKTPQLIGPAVSRVRAELALGFPLCPGTVCRASFVG